MACARRPFCARAVIVARVRLSDQTETSKVLEESSFQYYSTAFRCPEIFLVSHFLLFRSFFPSSSFSQPAKKNFKLEVKENSGLDYTKKLSY